MKNVTESKARKAEKKETAKKEATATIARANKVLKEKPLTTTKVTAKGTITKTQDNATLKVVKEQPRGTATREKNYIYRFQLEEGNKLTAKQEKRLRGKIRRQLKNVIDPIITANVKKEDLSGLPAFIKFYKDNFFLNDMSLQSMTNCSDELKQSDLNRVLTLAKKYQEQKKK